MNGRAFVLASALTLLASTANAERRTYINPIDIDYRYNWEQQNEGVSYRTGADPAIVRHKGAYYLFQTLADGYWRSTDLIDWTFITPSRWPFEGIVAPAVASDGDRLILMPSISFNRPNSILVSAAPETGKLDFLVRRLPHLPGGVDKPATEMKPGEVPPGPWDPGLFKDDDGQWYLYWGSSNVFPIFGQKIAFEDGKLIYQTRAEPLFNLQPELHGWERFGQDHNNLLENGQPTRPYVEGAWVTKHGGKYYLQYGAPGTQFNAYANGKWIAANPIPADRTRWGAFDELREHSLGSYRDLLLAERPAFAFHACDAVLLGAGRAGRRPPPGRPRQPPRLPRRRGPAGCRSARPPRRGSAAPARWALTKVSGWR